jgi:ankyrin repeat protein
MALFNTALWTAVSAGQTEEKSLLLLAKDADVNETTWSGVSALHLAAEKGYQLVVKVLVEKGADVNKGADVHLSTLHGESALHRAVEGGHVEAAKMLLGKGADVGATTEGGDTPLHYAAWDAPDMVQMLLDHGAGPNAKDTAGETPLHRAADGGNDAAVQTLLAKGGADVQAKTELGDSPLHLAIKGGHCEAVKMLLAKGADLRAKNTSGETPEDLASAPGQERVATVIAEVVATRRARREAAAMGQHHRLGAGSTLIRVLDPEVLRMILEQI